MFNPHNKFQLSPKLKLGIGRGYSKNKVFKTASAICLLIAGILALNTVRIIYTKTKAADNNDAPQVLGASDLRPDSPSGQNSDKIEFIEYKVQKNDTLFNISQKYNIDWATLATINNIQNPNSLKTGQTLKIPQ